MSKHIWKIKEIKKNGKKIIKNNFWVLIMSTIFLTLIFGSKIGNTSEYSNINNIDKDYTESSSEEKINFTKEMAKSVISQYLSGNSELIKTMEDLNSHGNVNSGYIYGAFNIIAKGETYFQNLYDSVINNEVKLDQFTWVIYLITIAIFSIKILIINPASVGEKRLYLESINYKKTYMSTLMFPFKKHHFSGVVKTTLLLKIYQTLWNITIIGGIIKHYSYSMTQYIIAENPQMKAREAITLSRKMMKGNKWKAFLTDLSFAGWEILNCVTLGVVGIYYRPYYIATFASLYVILRKEYIEEKNENYELLNDEKLFNNTDDEENYYGKVKEKKDSKVIKNAKNTYKIVDVVLMFFVFAIAGWFMEVLVFLLQTGTLVNRGTLYGPWLPIYGFGCSLMILLITIINRTKKLEKLKKFIINPFALFVIVMTLCTIMEYVTSYVLEITKGLKYWDYSGHFLSINGRVCLENSLFFGLGGCLCIYLIGPFLEKLFSKIPKKAKYIICIILIILIIIDGIYTNIYPHVGNNISNF